MHEMFPVAVLEKKPRSQILHCINLLKPNDIYIYLYLYIYIYIYMSYRSANLQTLLLNIYSTNVHTEYFKHAA